MFEVQSWLLARLLVREAGVPLKTEPGKIGLASGPRSIVPGVVKTIDLNINPSFQDG